MIRRLGPAVALAFVLAGVPGALAAFPSPMATQGKPLPNADGSLSYVASRAGSGTLLRALGSEEEVARSATIKGAFGIPVITPNGLAGGLFRNGRAFVLQSMGMHPRTEFRVIRTRDLGIQQSISLEGTFAYDALSPSGSRLYLIQHSSVQDLNHYVVRAYDLKAHKLMPGRIADKAQKGWVMQGWPVARATSNDGRWVYTLYTNPGGTPFVHALDTVKGIAHCVGFAWPATQDQDPIFNFTLAIDGPKLVVRNDGGSVYRVIDRKTWQVTAR